MVLTNGVLISIALPIAMLCLNMSRLIRGQDIFSGFQETLHEEGCCLLSRLQAKRETKRFPISYGEKRELQLGRMKPLSRSSPSRKFDFSMMRDDFETKGDTWVTPGIPLLVFFAAGYFVMLLYGDLVIGLIQLFFKTFA